jgi:hypothetical protein
MKWIKRGKIFDPTNHGISGFDCSEYAQSPQTLVFEDFVRVYFSTRKRDTTGKFLSFIEFVDFTDDFTRITNFSKRTVMPLGDLGTFDEHGIFPINVLNHNNKITAYTCGWSRRVSVSVETSTGLAISHDGGLTFERIGSGPVLTSSLHEPMLVGDSFVKVYNNKYHMWYIFGRGWFQPDGDESPARVYKIAHAISDDGVNWEKEEGKQIIADVLDENECQALPTVLKIGDVYHMVFCYRFATDFRKNHERGYRLGYAYSFDLINWKRDDKKMGLAISSYGWDSEMMCYPHLFRHKEKIYLLYNGNEFGKYGFGLAELEINV